MSEKFRALEIPTVGVPDYSGMISSGMLREAYWEQGALDSLAGAGSRLLNTYFKRDSGPLMSAQEAQDRFGMEGLSFTEPISEAEAELKRDMKQWERRRQFIMQLGTTSAWKGAQGMGLSMAASLANPLDAASMFVPFVGSSAKAQTVARAGGGMLSRAMARGVVTQETLNATLRYPKLSGAVIEGLMGQATIEPFVAWANFEDQADYTFGQAVTNIAAAGIGAGVLRKLLDSAVGAFDRMSPAAKLRAIEKAVNDLAHDKAVDIQPVRDMDIAVNDRHGAAEQIEIAEEASGTRLTREEFKRAKREIERARDERVASGRPGEDMTPHNATDILYLAEAASQRESATASAYKKLIERWYGGERSPEIIHQLSALLDKRYVPDAPPLLKRPLTSALPEPKALDEAELEAHRAYVREGKLKYVPSRDIQLEFDRALKRLEQSTTTRYAKPPPLPKQDIPKGAIPEPKKLADGKPKPAQASGEGQPAKPETSEHTKWLDDEADSIEESLKNVDPEARKLMQFDEELSAAELRVKEVEEVETAAINCILSKA